MGYVCHCTLSIVSYEHKTNFAYWHIWSTDTGGVAYLFCLPWLEGWGNQVLKAHWSGAVKFQMVKLGFESSFALWKSLPLSI